jgi:hypothetical protein
MGLDPKTGKYKLSSKALMPKPEGTSQGFKVEKQRDDN